MNKIASVLSLAVLLAACGDDADANAKKAADSLKGYAPQSPPNIEWRLSEVTVEDGQLFLVVAVDEGIASALKYMGRIPRSRMAQTACPPLSAPVWKFLGKDRAPWVNLIGPDTKVVVSTRCKR